VASRKLKIISISAGLLVVVLVAAAWSMWPRVEEVPAQLPEVSEEVSIPDLTLDAQGPLPALRLGDLDGQMVLLMIEGRESMTGGEGKQLHRAIARWQLPADVVAVTIGDAPAGAALMRKKIERDFLGPMRAEMRYPIYIDYGGRFAEALALPKGHLGVAVLDRSGELVFRHAGDLDEATLAELERLLGAEDPPPGPPVPSFGLAELDDARCREQTCALVFLDAKVARADIPGLEHGGFEGGPKQSFAQIAKPSVRLARVLTASWDRSEVAGVVVGEAEGWEVEGWPFVASDDRQVAATRAAFGIDAGAAGMVIVDEGRVAFAESGLIPFWRLGLAADILGIDPEAFSGRRKRDE